MSNMALEQAAATVKALHGILHQTVGFKLWDVVEPPLMPTADEVEAVIEAALKAEVGADAVVVATVTASQAYPGKWRVTASVDGLTRQVMSDRWLGTDIPHRPEGALLDIVRALLIEAKQRLIETAKQ